MIEAVMIGAALSAWALLSLIHHELRKIARLLERIVWRQENPPPPPHG